MSPSEAYSMDMRVLGDMIAAHMRVQEEELDEKMSLLAWQTSLLMTATGNYKKGIKPKDLYVSMHERQVEDHKNSEPVDIEALRTELLNTFSDSVAEGSH